jgi:Icc-related predicted phosphoesterase
MRILYATDIHAAKTDLESLLELTSADLYLIAGDLIYSTFYSQKNLLAFYELQEYVRAWRQAAGRTEINLKEFAQELLRRGAVEPQRTQLSEFLRLAELAERNVVTKYQGIENILRLKGRSQVYTIPGNYDVDLDNTALAHRNLHRREIDLGGLRIAGYGSANIWTPGIPEHIAAKFPEYRVGRTLYSEPADFFRRVRPDIMLVHNPPQGFHDRLRGFGNVGSPGLRDVVDEIPEVQVVLSGHVHEDWGVRVYDGKVLVNPSNFGEVVDANGYLEGGTFFEFEMVQNNFRWGMLRKVERSRVYDLIEYHYDGKKLSSEVIDLRRVEALSNRKPSVEPMAQAKDGRHIPEIVLFNKLKFYFRRFETGEAEQRVEDLRKAVDVLGAEGHQFAFDILGSVNFGISFAESDLDAVAYTFLDKSFVKILLRDSFQKVIGDRYKVELTDIIDLNQVRESILHQDSNCDETQRFVFYRAIGRPVNLRLLRQFDDLLERNPDFRREVEEKVREYIKVLQTTSSQTLSLRKYESRLRDLGTKIPPHIAKKIKQYLQLEVPMGH